jgi:hypothetical protein
MSDPRGADADRDALIRLQRHIASNRPPGILAGLRWRFKLRQAEGILELEDRRRERGDLAAPWRRQMLGGTALVLGVSAISGLFFSHHALTVARAAYVLGLCAAGGLGLVGWAFWASRRMERSAERQYQRWLERARALPAGLEQGQTLPPASAV